MSDYFFYDLNKKMADLANKQQLAETAKTTPVKPAPSDLRTQLNERDLGKHNNATTGFAALAKKTGGGEKGAKIAGAQLAKMRAKGQVEESKKECPPMSHIKKMCQDGKSLAEISKMHPDCDQTKLRQMVADCKKKLSEDSKPDFLDLDKDGDRKEPMKSAARGAKKNVDESTCPSCKCSPCKCDSMDESALQAAFGKKKYGDQGMKALQKAGRDHASDSTMKKIRNRYDKYDESMGMTDEGNAFSGAVVKAKRDGIQPGEKITVGGKQYELKEVDATPQNVDDPVSPMNKPAPKASAARSPVPQPKKTGQPKMYPPQAIDDPVKEAAKYRDPKYKNKLYTQEPPDYTYGPDMDDAYYNPKPDDYAGRKRKIGGGEFPSTDPLERGQGIGRSGIKNNILDRGPRKGMPSRNQITSLKGSIKDVLGKHTEPNLPEGSMLMTAKQQKFAKLAPPMDKITFADKIVGAKKAVDEMLGDVAADAMKKAVRGGDRDMEEASTGNAFDYKNFKQPEKQKPTSFVHKGTYGTEYDGDKDDAKALATKKRAAAAAGQGSRGRGRPKNNASAETGEVMKPDFSAFGDKVKLKPHAGKITKHKMVGEDDIDPKDQGEYDQEGEMAKDSIKTVVRHAHALEKILGDNDNLPEWVQSKLAKIENMMTAVDDYMQNQKSGDMPMDEESTNKRDSRAERAGRKVAKDIEYDEKKKDGIHGRRRGSEDSRAEQAGKKVTKDIEYDEKKDKKKKEVDETTTSGSVATSGSAAPKSSGGMSYGKGIYDSLNRQLENMIAEGMNINMSMNNDSHGGPTHSLTVTATDEDAMALASILRMAGMGGGNDHMPHMNNGVVQPDNIKVIDFDDGTDDLAAELSNELHGGDHSDHSDTCPTCGSSDCGCDDADSMHEAYGDTDATENHPDYPTDAEGTDDAMMYSGGIDGPKSTGQSTVPVLASQQDRQHAYEDTAALRRMMEMAGLPVAEAAPPVKLATPQHVDEPVSPASSAAAADKKPVVKPVTKSATPQHVDEPVKPVKEDQMAHSLMRELHNFKY